MTLTTPRPSHLRRAYRRAMAAATSRQHLPRSRALLLMMSYVLLPRLATLSSHTGEPAPENATHPLSMSQ